MNGLPYYRRYPRDFLEGTVGMPFDLKGAYGLLLDLIYMQGGRLPDDPRYIAGLLGCSVRAWNKYRSDLLAMGKISADLGIISNFRADKELETSSSFQEKQREKASKSRKNNGLPKAAAEPKPSHTVPVPVREEDLRSSPPPLNVPREPEGGRGGREDQGLLQRVMAACGAREFPCTSQWMPPAASIHVRRWITDLGLTEDEVVAVAGAEQRRHAERAKMDGRSGADPPSGPKALDNAMKALAAEKAAPPMQPAIPRIANGNAPHNHQRADAAIDRAIDDLRAGRIDSIVAGPFAPGASRRR